MHMDASLLCVIYRCIDDDVSYDVRVRAVSATGVRSAYSTASGHTVVGKLTAPGVPTGLSATGRRLSILLQWTANAEGDVLGYDIQRADNSGFTTNLVTLVDVYGGNYYLDNLGVKAITRYYRVRAHSRSDLQSAYTSGVNATTLGIDTLEINDNAIENLQLGPLSVDTAELNTNAVTNAKIDALAVDTAELATDAVTNVKIAALAVDTGELATDAVTNAKIAALAVDTAELAALSISTAKLQAQAVTNAEIANLAVDTAQIALLAVDTAQVAAKAIETAKIDDLAVDTGQIAADAIETDKVLDDAVTIKGAAFTAASTGVYSNTAWSTIQSVTLTLDSGQEVLVLGKQEMGVATGGGASAGLVRLMHAGTGTQIDRSQQWNGHSLTSGGPSLLGLYTTLSSGSHTFNMQQAVFAIGGSMFCAQRGLAVIQMRK